MAATSPGHRFQLRRAFDRLFRHYARLTWALNQQGAEPTLDLIWAAGAVVLDGCELEAAARAVAVTSRDVPRLAGLLGRVSGIGLDHPAMADDVRLECPPALFGDLSSAFGSNVSAELGALNLPGPADLRANTLRTHSTELASMLLAEDITTLPMPYSSVGLRAKGYPDLASTPAFESGLFEMQDEGSQLIALLTHAQPGQQVLDFCAGAGGKTMGLAAMMNNRGHLVAADTSQRRLTRAKHRLKRAGVENAERILLTGDDQDPFLKRRARWFDRVLVDAPCSGSGSWRRHPEAKWRDAANLGELVRTQATILSRAANLVKRGGLLVYATCSLLPAENEAQAEGFGAGRSDFRVVDAASVWEKVLAIPWPCPQRRYLSLTPAQHGTDGFFAALFERTT